MEKPNLKFTTIKITQEMLDDFESYCKSEYKTGLSNRQEMVIIGCSKDDEEYLVLKSDIPKIIGIQKLKYLISSENILGYIDLESLNVIYNTEYIHSYSL